ncbi:MAG: cobalamin-binding protein [Treponema sp.]|jgi:iron complex transport system substrate-binding protein|nr:cobalamin-binding protein [Treponema sp.]
MKTRISLLAACFLILFHAPLHAQTELTDALGKKFVLRNAARRIVSLSPAATEILFAVGAGGQVVGRTEFCDYPAAALSVPVVGGFSGATVSVESIAALKSDLALVSADMHQRLVPLLEGIGVMVFALEPRNFEEVFAVIEIVGRLTGREQSAARVARDMKVNLARIETRTRGKKAPAVFWELYDSPLMTSGGDTLVNEAITRAGGRNIFANERGRWMTVSFEQVLVRDPEWILMGSDHDVDVTARPLWSAISAVKNNRIAVIDANTIYRYGPRLVDAVSAIARLLHP